MATVQRISEITKRDAILAQAEADHDFQMESPAQSQTLGTRRNFLHGNWGDPEDIRRREWIGGSEL